MVVRRGETGLRLIGSGNAKQRGNIIQGGQALHRGRQVTQGQRKPFGFGGALPRQQHGNGRGVGLASGGKIKFLLPRRNGSQAFLQHKMGIGSGQG